MSSFYYLNNIILFIYSFITIIHFSSENIYFLITFYIYNFNMNFTHLHYTIILFYIINFYTIF